jgi:hypothetical protein
VSAFGTQKLWAVRALALGAVALGPADDDVGEVVLRVLLG